LGSNEGLESSYISAIFRDSRGYYWFGSRRGITRYDGYRFHYYALANDGEHKTVGAITEDLNGNIWISFSSLGGLTMFDGYHFYDYVEGNGLALEDTYLGIIHFDKKGNIWLKSENHIVKFDGKEFTSYPYYFQNLKGLNIILIENEKGEFWISAKGGLCHLSESKMTFHEFENTTIKNLCHPISDDQRGLLFSFGNGIGVLQNNTLKTYNASFFVKNTIRYTMSLGKDFMLVSDQNRTAFCNFSDSALQITHENNALLSNAAPFFIDEWKNVWFGKPGIGALLYNPNEINHFQFESLDIGGHISAIYPDKKGTIWFGTHGNGLFKYDGITHQYIPLLKTQEDEIVIRSILEAKDGSIWVGTEEFGLFRLVPQSADFATFQITNFTSIINESSLIYSLAQDNENAIWIGTSNKGLIKFDGTEFSRIQYLSDEDLTQDSKSPIRSLIVDSAGTLWVGSINGGLTKITATSTQHFTEKQGLSSNNVVSLLLDHKSNLWIGSQDKGIDKFDGVTFENFSTEDGLTSNTIWTVTQDAENNIWLGANTCLNTLLANEQGEIEKQGLKIKTYCDLGGLTEAEFYANTGVVDSEQKIWWGTDRMAIMIKDVSSFVSKRSLTLQLEDINLVNYRVDFKQLEDSILSDKSWIIGSAQQVDLTNIHLDGLKPFVNCPEKLQLPPTINDISFIYSTKGAIPTSEIQFSYMLKGLDKDWSLPTPNNNIDYRNLDPGTYVMMARVSEVKGVWSEPLLYTFEVLPFWWQSWWASLLWIVLIIALVTLVYYYLRKRRKEIEKSKRLLEIDQLKTEFYANITHEFRTPLTMIIGTAEQLEQNSKEKNIILKNSENLLHQVNELLDAAKLDSGALTLDYQQEDMVVLLQLITDSFTSLSNKKDIQLTFYSEEKSLVMDLDEQKLQHIVYNLISNAIKFTPNGGKIIVHLSTQTKAGKSVLLKVTDSGIGMSMDQQKKIFDRFYQVALSNSINIGTGIGLSFTKELVELMKGEISVKSELNNGTEFKVLLPITHQHPIGKGVSTILKYQNVSTTTEHTSVEGDLNELETDLEEKRVLIVEDNDEIAVFIANLLRSNYKVYIAKDGLEGKDLAYNIMPDAIISDVNMPNMNGYELCNHLKKDTITSHIPIILLTAKSTTKDKIEGLQFGADAYITKPFHKEELEVTLNNLIQIRTHLQRYYSQLTSDTETTFEINETLPLENEFILKLQQLIETHLSNSEFGVPELSDLSGISSMQVYRKLKSLTGKTPSQFIKSYRLNKAMDLLKKGQLTISEIAYEVGFSDPNYFSRSFHQEFGNPPGHYRKS
jgi:signal transduction histidine kinase/DNA-binding response OmpR family regulator/ligand-binding sensor domain-containing protein